MESFPVPHGPTALMPLHYPVPNPSSVGLRPCGQAQRALCPPALIAQRPAWFTLWRRHEKIPLSSGKVTNVTRSFERRVREYLRGAQHVSTLLTNHWLENEQAGMLSRTRSKAFDNEPSKEEKLCFRANTYK